LFFLQTFKINNHLKTKFGDLYANDTLFDRFECSPSGDGFKIATGAYHRYMHIFDINKTIDSGELGHIVLQANRLQPRPVKRKTSQGSTYIPVSKGKKRKEVLEELNPEKIDYIKSVLHVSFNPKDNIIAASSLNNLFIFTA